MSRPKYDVFLSFRGEDTREKFTSHVNAELNRKKIKTFIDNELERGDEINPSLIKAIEESFIYVVILSEHYASSHWCLDELTKILDCKNKYGREVIPVFYEVDPSDVRNQRKSFEIDFQKHQHRPNDKIDAWKAALTQVANLSGLDSQNFSQESTLVEKIAEDILKKLNRPISSDYYEGMTGMDKHIKQIQSLMQLESPTIRIIGIWGMGGIGKTTIASAIFEKFATQFDFKSIVLNVQQEIERAGLSDVKSKYLTQLLGEDIKCSVNNFSFDPRLKRTNVLLVFDDVKDSNQLKDLIGTHSNFGQGSRIIVTSRNRQVLENSNADEIYQVSEMDDQVSLQLFCLCAFKQNHPIEEAYVSLSKKVLDYAKGVPLALQVLGSLLNGKSKGDWESQLQKLEKLPEDGIFNVLKLSYDGLDDNQKDIFLDIACFHRGQFVRVVEQTLDCFGFFTGIEMKVLEDRCLISISKGKVWMHDLIQEMGHGIVRLQNKDPEKRSRLWKSNDVYDVLKKNKGKGTDAIRCIFLDMKERKDVQLHAETFKKMHNLRMIKFYTESGNDQNWNFHGFLKSFPDSLKFLCWGGFPQRSLPQDFCPENLITLEMRYSHLEQLWEAGQASMHWQKSRVTWLKEGDANSKFFHGIMSARRRFNSIGSLEQNGRAVVNVPEVRQLVFQHFSDHFRKKQFNRYDISGLAFHTLSLELGAELTKPFLMEEIKSAVWDCDSFKCPGPDGINLGFFKDFWELLKVDLLNFFAEFHHHGVITKGLNSTFIALIPKVDCPQRVADFRPIALVSSIYKILSKVLANRLRNVVGHVVSEAQSAFIKGRQILDGILIANEIVDDAKRNRKDLLMFKVDFEKAYDSVDWDYLDDVMLKMNFPSQWRKWMLACITTATASILVNGSPTDEFCFQRGLRQGDPLSPFLFLLAAEGLNVLMVSMVRNGLFIPYSVGPNSDVSVSHLQFADDTLLIGGKSWANVRALKAVLILFENISGLKVNFHKSMLFGVNINNSWLHEAASVMRCRHGSMPFHYLGLPIGGDARRIQFWKPLLDRIRRRLSGWKCKNLSVGGRLILLKFVLSSIPVYFLSFFKAPAGIVTSLESILCHFFWGGCEESNKISWVKWDTVCSLREKGGLGVRRVKEFNYALLGKWVWRCLEEGNSLWCRLLQAKYGQEGVGRVRFGAGVGSSWWRALNQVRLGMGIGDSRWMTDHVIRKVGDGTATNFWVDSWLECGPLERIFSRLYELAENKDISVADMFEAGWGVNEDGWKWRRRLFAWEEELVVQCVGVLANFVLQDGVSDRWVWKLHSTQCYTVRSAYAFLTISEDNFLEDCANYLWLKAVPLKVNIFIWRLFFNRLPTKDNLLQRGAIEDHQLQCSAMCGNSEDAAHLFFTCEFYGQLWLLVSNWLGIMSAFQGTLGGHAAQFSGLGGDSRQSRTLFIIIWISVLFVIWKDRNARIFRSVSVSCATLLERIKLQTYWWLKSNFALFDFDYCFWRLNPWLCLQAIL